MHLELLRDLGIDSIEKANKTLIALRQKSEDKTEQEKVLQTVLESYIANKNQEAQIYTQATREFGDEYAQYIFQDTNKFVSWNPHEEFNFDLIKKTWLLSDPELPDNQKFLIQAEYGKPVPVMRLFSNEALPWWSDPELSSIMIIKEKGDRYSIPSLGISHQSMSQLMEYTQYMQIYADLWLSQLLPHMLRINTELKKQGIDAEIDGKMSIEKQKNILKFIYLKLFDSKLVSTNIYEIKHMFRNALWNPSTMRWPMQSALLEKSLITTNNSPISHNAIERWLSGKSEQLDRLNLT